MLTHLIRVPSMPTRPRGKAHLPSPQDQGPSCPLPLPQGPVLHSSFCLRNCPWPQRVVGFPGGSAGKESAYNAGDLGSIPGLGRSPGEGNGYPLQYSGLENSMDSIIYGIAKSWTRLSDFHTSAAQAQAGGGRPFQTVTWG